MKKHWLASVAALALLSVNTYAADDKTAAPEATPHKEWTLEDARKHAHEYAEKLDKMTPEEWAERQKKRHEWAEKWKTMTPEEKEALRKKQHDKREAAKTKAADTKPVAVGQ